MRDETLRQAKATLRAFFAGQDDKYLTRVADECRAGVFCFRSTCHCLKGLLAGGYSGVAASTESANSAERALCELGIWGRSLDRVLTEPGYQGHIERARTLPLVLAEIRRRTKAQQPAPVAAEVEHAN